MDRFVLRGARVVDGTGAPAATPTVVVADGLIESVGDEPRARRRRRGGRPRRPRAGARLHRPAHPLRRPGPVGPRPHAVVVARRHHRGHGQLRLRARADPAGRPRHGHAGAGERRGHAARRARGGHPVDLRDLPRVPRRARRAAAPAQRRAAARPHAAALLRDGRRRDRAGGHRRRDRGDAGDRRRGARRRRDRVLVLPLDQPRRRARPSGAEPGRVADRARRAPRAAARARRRATSRRPGGPTSTSTRPRPSRSASAARCRGRRSWPTSASPARRSAPPQRVREAGGRVHPQIACRPIVVQIALERPGLVRHGRRVHSQLEPAFPLLPGAGRFPLLDFMDAVCHRLSAAMLSLEIFNDQFRAGSPRGSPSTASARSSISWISCAAKRGKAACRGRAADAAAVEMPRRRVHRIRCR